jgi:hypothetical protein
MQMRRVEQSTMASTPSADFPQETLDAAQTYHFMSPRYENK